MLALLLVLLLMSGAASQPAPDYADARNWAAHGTGKGDVDVFYVHPTTFRAQVWNQDLADAAVNRATDEGMLRSQASAFDACCRIFAPRYRQASSRAFAEIEGEGQRAYDLAYGDVERAFDAYLASDNRGRPFILAGHSQGAQHVLRLLLTRIEGTKRADQLVAAYVVGIGVPAAIFGRELTSILPCTRPAQTRCVASWNSFVDGSDVHAYVERSQRRIRAGDEGLLCTNPSSFDAKRPATSRASCEGGVLFVHDATMQPLPGGSLHLGDIELFYDELRANAVQRSRASRSVHDD